MGAGLVAGGAATGAGVGAADGDGYMDPRAASRGGAPMAVERMGGRAV